MQLEVNGATGSGINLVPIDWSENAANNWKYNSIYTLPTPVNITAGTKIIFTVSVPSSYITDGNLALQVTWGAGAISQYGGGGDGGWVGMWAVTPGQDWIITETVPSGGQVSNADRIGIQVARAPTDTSILDKILIKKLEIQ